MATETDNAGSYGLRPDTTQAHVDGPRSSSGGMSPRDWMAMRAAERREEAQHDREDAQLDSERPDRFDTV